MVKKNKKKDLTLQGRRSVQQSQFDPLHELVVMRMSKAAYIYLPMVHSTALWCSFITSLHLHISKTMIVCVFGCVGVRLRERERVREQAN